MDIGTAKPSRSERDEVPHHMLDVIDPDEEWSVARWADAARRVITAIEERGHRALLVGGTGLYFQALVDGLRPPGRWPEVRARLDSEPDTLALHRRLSVVDPAAAAKMQPSNRRRVIRALEVSIGAGRPFSSFGSGMTSYPSVPWRVAGLWLPRAVVARRIHDRLQEMVDRGFVEEVARLRARPGGMARTARQALGYREILAHIEADVPLEDALEEVERRTRGFARRQRVWWRRDPRVWWFGTAHNSLAVTAQILGQWS
jgi:tRNA dimethylallyltransferase